jgi:hypothetical protein
VSGHESDWLSSSALAISILALLPSVLQAIHAKRGVSAARRAPWSTLVFKWVEEECESIIADEVAFRAFITVPHESRDTKKCALANLNQSRKAALVRLHRLKAFEPSGAKLLSSRSKLGNISESFLENAESELAAPIQDSILGQYFEARDEHLHTLREFVRQFEAEVS